MDLAHRQVVRCPPRCVDGGELVDVEHPGPVLVADSGPSRKGGRCGRVRLKPIQQTPDQCPSELLHGRERRDTVAAWQWRFLVATPWVLLRTSVTPHFLRTELSTMPGHRFRPIHSACQPTGCDADVVRFLPCSSSACAVAGLIVGGRPVGSTSTPLRTGTAWCRLPLFDSGMCLREPTTPMLTLHAFARESDSRRRVDTASRRHGRSRPLNEGGSHP